MNILVLFTCYNRKSKSENCIIKLNEENPDCKFTFVVVDDGSTDGTWERLEQLQSQYSIHLIKGMGNLYYSRGMRFGMKYIREKIIDTYDYFLMVNDDVDFYSQCICNIIQQSQKMNHSVIVGATCNSEGKQTYGAVKYTKGIKYRNLSIEEWQIEADTFNANCVLIPWKIFKNVDIMDEHYVHSLGDFDYGLQIKKEGYKIYSSNCYVGVCEENSIKNTWEDISLGIGDRIRKKESFKGAPIKPWFYFLKKNFGLRRALVGAMTPYIKILFILRRR